MKKLLLLVVAILGIVTAYSQTTVKTKFSFERSLSLTIRFEFSNEYKNVRMYLLKDESYERGDLLRVLSSDVYNGCAKFEVLGADNKIFYLMMCDDGSFAYGVDGDVTETYNVYTWENGL